SLGDARITSSGFMRNEKRARRANGMIVTAASSATGVGWSTASSKSGRARTRADFSGMDADSRAVEKHRIANAHLRKTAGRRGEQLPANQRSSGLDEGQRDCAAVVCAPVAGRHMAERTHRHHLVGLVNDLRAFLEN